MESTLEVSPRVVIGKGENRKARSRGLVPAVVYGKTQKPVPVAVDPAKLVEVFKQTQDRNTILSIKVGDGDAIPCLVREVQRHPLSRKIIHVDFYAVPTEDAIEVVVPIRPVGRPKGALLGGRLRLVRREIRISARYDVIPEAIEVDVSDLDIADNIRASAMTLPDGVTLVIDNDFIVITVTGKQSDRQDAVAAPAAAEAAKA